MKQKQKTPKARRVNKDYVNQYSQIILTQPLANNNNIQQIFTKSTKGWIVSYTTNSIYHICPYDGFFRSCKDCGALEDDFDIEFCTNKIEVLSGGAVSERVNDCLKADLKVQFID